MRFLSLAVAALTWLTLANGLALYTNYPYVYTTQGTALVTPTQRQYLSQDALGHYAYGYAEPHSSKQEVRSLDGITRGSYSYRDAAGKLQRVDYTADAAGFHVTATNLPISARSIDAAAQQQPADSVEVAAARQTHLAAHEATRLLLKQAQQQSNPDEQQIDKELQSPVEDTAEVAAAKSNHLKRVAAEQLRNELLSGRSAPVGRSSHVILPVHSVYGYTVPRYYNSGIYY
ncbi:GH15887 [Drosophila grimshawi]|uniref:GH15887 n=1 Tax=Drosophila grimshawi TaxID=7222 RepID=B4J0U3_DROGR|nr:GH15887 [Drosophila grimshawi]